LQQGDNQVAGPDLTWQATPNLRLRAQWLASRTTALPDASGALAASAAQTGSALYANAFWRADPYEAGATIENKTLGFRNDNGFVTQTGVRRLALDAHRVWRNQGPLNEIWLNLNTENVQDPVTRATVYSQVTPGLYTGYSNNSEFSMEFRGLSRQRVSAASELLQERYWHFYYSRNAALWAPQVSVEYDRGRMVDVSANQVRAGERVKLSATLRPLARLELLPTWSLAQLHAPQGGTTYRESAAQRGRPPGRAAARGGRVPGSQPDRQPDLHLAFERRHHLLPGRQPRPPGCGAARVTQHRAVCQDAGRHRRMAFALSCGAEPAGRPNATLSPFVTKAAMRQCVAWFGPVPF